MTIIKARKAGRGRVIEMTVPHEVRILSDIREGDLLKVDPIKRGFKAVRVRCDDGGKEA